MKGVNFPAVQPPENDFNPIQDMLSRIVTDQHIEECLLSEHLVHIDHWMNATSPVYWLMICRLSEAALVSAGYYADRGEFSAAGDLLVNPREIVIHIAGQPTARKKKRHGRISDQFRRHDQPAAEFPQWFNRNAAIEQKQPPLIPFLYHKLQTSGWISGTYLETIDARMKKIADTISFLAAWGVRSFHDVAGKQIQCREGERRFMEKNLCGFDTALFQHIENEIRTACNNRNFSSCFLSAACRNHH